MRWLSSEPPSSRFAPSFCLKNALTPARFAQWRRTAIAALVPFQSSSSSPAVDLSILSIFSFCIRKSNHKCGTRAIYFRISSVSLSYRNPKTFVAVITKYSQRKAAESRFVIHGMACFAVIHRVIKLIVNWEEGSVVSDLVKSINSWCL